MLLEILLPESFYWYLLTHCFIMSHILKILHVYYVSYLTIAYLVTVSLWTAFVNRDMVRVNWLVVGGWEMYSMLLEKGLIQACQDV